MDFIDLHQKMSLLWDPNNPKYNKLHKHDAWERIAKMWNSYQRMQKEDGQFTFLFQKRKRKKTAAANNWWITARSQFTKMRAVLSKPKPRGEQNPARLRCGRLLESGRGVSSVTNLRNPSLSRKALQTARSRTVPTCPCALLFVHSMGFEGVQ